MSSDEQQKESRPLAFQVDGRSYTMEYDQAFAKALDPNEKHQRAVPEEQNGTSDERDK